MAVLTTKTDGGDDPTSVATPRAPEIEPALPEDERTKTIRHNDGFELVAGTILGDYQIEEMIGEGGMGVVYAAMHPIIRRRVAIKILKKELCDDPDSVERFIDEARAANHIQHPNIVDIFSIGEISGRCYLAMEWLQGESLRDRIERGAVTLAETCAVLRPLALALGAAHAKNVIHRDLKPDNVFLLAGDDDQPRVKLLDFGLAKLNHGERGVTRTAAGALLGTPQYIAPEQARGLAIDHRVDIYALGVVAFEMLAGRPPFVTDNAMEMIAKHLMEPPPRLSSITEVPRDVDDLIDAMLAKEPDARPSIDQVLATLQRSADPVTTIRYEPSIAQHKRSRLRIVLGTAVIACGVLAAVIVGTGGNDALVIDNEDTATPLPAVPVDPVDPVDHPATAESEAPPEEVEAAPTSTAKTIDEPMPPSPPDESLHNRDPGPRTRKPVKPAPPPRPGRRTKAQPSKPEVAPPEPTKSVEPKPAEKLPDGLVKPGTFGGRS